MLALFDSTGERPGRLVAITPVLAIKVHDPRGSSLGWIGWPDVVWVGVTTRVPVSYASNVFNAASMNALSGGFTPSPAACPQIEGIGRNSALGT
jgi:hypothetical protein